MGKILGYILATMGILGIAIYSLPEFFKYSEDFIKEIIGNNSFTLNATGILIVSTVLILGGLFLVMQGGGRRGRNRGGEVPIYHGKNVVGYRRH